MINLFNGYVPPFTPLSNITPFTHRDGLTYLDVLEELRKFVNDDMVKFINENFTGLGDAVTEEVNKLITDLTAAIEEQTTIVNDQLTNQNNAVTAQLDEQNSAIGAAMEVVNAGVSSINATLASAIAARDAAAAANTGAQSAKTSAETARDNAIGANTTAQAAKTAAETAKAAAETASGTAVGANTTAQAAKTAAETAKTAAETASGAAVAANTAAQSAKTAAETAKTGAETAKTAADAAVTSIGTTVATAIAANNNARANIRHFKLDSVANVGTITGMEPGDILEIANTGTNTQIERYVYRLDSINGNGWYAFQTHFKRAEGFYPDLGIPTVTDEYQITIAGVAATEISKNVFPTGFIAAPTVQATFNGQTATAAAVTDAGGALEPGGAMVQVHSVTNSQFTVVLSRTTAFVTTKKYHVQLKITGIKKI